MADEKKGNAGDQNLGHVLLLLLKFAGWLLFIAAGCLLVLARPPSTTIADRIYQTVPRQEWNMDLIRHIGPVLLAAIACTPIGLVIYSLGIQRRKYALPVSLILSGLLAVTGLVAFLRYTPGF
jgi:hypothetical protein